MHLSDMQLSGVHCMLTLLGTVVFSNAFDEAVVNEQSGGSQLQ